MAGVGGLINFIISPARTTKKRAVKIFTAKNDHQINIAVEKWMAIKYSAQKNKLSAHWTLKAAIGNCQMA